MFEVFDPEAASSWSFDDSAAVSGAELTAGFGFTPSKDSNIMVNSTFNVSVDIRDLSSDLVLTDIAWQVRVYYKHCYYLEEYGN